ncbi:nucleoside recognition protein [Halobaculum sp. MBLA0143]|uniref:nucleoside recognition protein n=1 Tax=Halobaculum sp. MBLA0143 TaxID=3079933 RepID=UPI003524F42A
MLPRAGERVVRISVLISVGVFLANLAVSFGAVERIAGVSRFLTGPANLPDEVGTAILTTAASTTAGYGMLADFRESGRLSDRATLVAVTINTFFGFTQHIFTFYAPVIVPILGRETGLLYVGTRGAIALGITLTGVVAGAVLLTDRDVDETVTVETDATETAADGGSEGGPRAAVAEAWSSTAGKLRSIVPRLAAVYLLVSVLAAAEAFRSLSAAAGPLAEVAGLPAAAVPVIVVFAFDTTAGAATVAPLIGGTLTVDQAVVTMLLGGIVTFAVSTFKRSIPFQYGIWGASFGSKVIVVNTVLKVVFISGAVVWFLI